jgi:transposase-like protein
MDDARITPDGRSVKNYPARVPHERIRGLQRCSYKMGQRRSQRQLRDQALFLREKRKKSVAALAFAFDVSKGTMQQWLADARRDRRALDAGSELQSRG